MKKYILKLLYQDYDIQIKRLTYWYNLEDKHRNTEYQIKVKNSLDNKIKTIKRYIERIEKLSF